MLRFALPAAALLASSTAGAQSIEERVAVAHEAEERGAELYRHDRAIALAVDAKEREPGAIKPFLAPATLSLPVGASNRIAVSFYGFSGEGFSRTSTYEVDPDEESATRTWFFTEGELPALSPAEEKLLSSFETALSADLADGEEDDCPDAKAKTIVLPPREDGIVPVYRLTQPEDPASVALGRSERFDIGPDGEVAAHAVLNEACETISWDVGDDELAMRSYLTTYRAAPQPNEIHSYAGRFLPFALGVVTGDLVWPVLGGSIAEPVEADPEMIAD